MLHYQLNMWTRCLAAAKQAAIVAILGAVICVSFLCVHIFFAWHWPVSFFTSYAEASDICGFSPRLHFCVSL
jgi:hypothetical protein